MYTVWIMSYPFMQQSCKYTVFLLLMQRGCISFVLMGNIRQTKSVRALLGVFEQANHAVSATSLVDRFQHQMNKTTVYRILERLKEDGVLYSFTGKDGLKWYARYEGSGASQHVEHHAHFQCKSCGKVECLPSEFTLPAIPANHQVHKTELLLVGWCEGCVI